VLAAATGLRSLSLSFNDKLRLGEERWALLNTWPLRSLSLGGLGLTALPAGPYLDSEGGSRCSVSTERGQKGRRAWQIVVNAVCASGRHEYAAASALPASCDRLAVLALHFSCRPLPACSPG